jgi:hypothetical protein
MDPPEVVLAVGLVHSQSESGYEPPMAMFRMM